MAVHFHQTGYINATNWDKNSDGSPKDPENFGLYKVYFPEVALVSDWSPRLTTNSKLSKSSIPFDINEQVVCLVSFEYDQVEIIGSRYNLEDGNKPDPASGPDVYRELFSDNTFIEYDRSTHELKIDNQNHDVKVTMNNGNYGGLITLVDPNNPDKGILARINKVERDNNSFKTLLQTLLTTTVNEPGNGAPSAFQIAFNAAATNYYGNSLIVTQKSDIEDTNVKH